MSPSTDKRENREFASELKFMVPRARAPQIRDWARERLAPDPNADGESGDGYQIRSLYFDTEHFDVFHRQGSFGRSKYRIRRYGPSELVFLERKLKTRGLVSKRRSLVKIDEINRLAKAEVDAHWTGCWYHQRLLVRSLRPVCEISYYRTARVSMTSLGPIRLTLDDRIRASIINGMALNGEHEGVTLAADHLILELKYLVEMPVLFKLLVEEFALNPQPVSKYRLAMVALGYVAQPVMKAPAPGELEPSVCLNS